MELSATAFSPLTDLKNSSLGDQVAGVMDEMNKNPESTAIRGKTAGRSAQIHYAIAPARTVKLTTHLKCRSHL